MNLHKIFSLDKLKKNLFIIGDIHGCYDELAELISKIPNPKNTTIISVGDIIEKGPDSEKCLTLLRDHNALFVYGNHEISWLCGTYGESIFKKIKFDDSIKDQFKRKKEAWLNNSKSTEITNPKNLKYLESGFMSISIPELNLGIVHAGVDLRSTTDETDHELLTRIRYVNRETNQISDFKSRPKFQNEIHWSEAPNTPEMHWIIGHHHSKEQIIHTSHATRLDTGCVYGGRLTGLLIDCSNRYERCIFKLFQVTAKRKYQFDWLN